MSVIAAMQGVWEFNRMLTGATVHAIASSAEPNAALGWRPRPGGAHIAWQLMHIAITEELFATEHLIGTPPRFPELLPRFRGMSTPDDEIPSIDLIREVLAASRRHLLETMGRFSDEDLATIVFPERGWSLETTLRALTWHEAHHQGQVQVTFNLWKSAQEAR